MVLPISLIIVLGFGSLLSLTFIAIVLTSSSKYKYMIEPLNDKEYILKDIYTVGFFILDKINYNFKSKSDRKTRSEIDVVYGSKYAEFYLNVMWAQKISLSFFILLLAFPLFAITNDVSVFIISLAFSGVTYYYFATTTKNKILKRSNELLSDFPDVVAKLALLTNAGMIMREAWEKVAHTGKGTLYDEMLLTIDEMLNGISEIDAFYNFGRRCIIPEIKKFTAILVQGMVKGNQEIVAVLRQQSKEIWSIKKHNVKQQGEKAASKLLIPISLMFIGILIMIIVPIFTGIGA